MNIQNHRNAFNRDGFIVIEKFFDDDLMDHLDELIRTHYGDNPEFWHNDAFLKQSRTEVVPWFPQQEGIKDFDPIEHDARLQALTDSILGNGWVAQYCMVMFSRQGTAGQAWHQDCPSEDPTQHNLNRLVYTRDITEETGGQIVVVPGSFKQGELPAGDPDGDFDRQVVLTPGKGALILLHGHTWHRVLPIKSEHRFSTNFRSAPKGASDDITDICVYRNMRYQFSTSSVLEERLESIK